MELIREFCAENMTLVPAAIAAGARRIELCDNLSVGGTSPSYGVIKAAAAFAQARGADVMVMVRPRGGDFVYSERERLMMLDDIACARSLRVTGVVFGCTRADDGGRQHLDEELTRELVDAAKGPGAGIAMGTKPLQVTFHMAFDVLNPEEQLHAIDVLANRGVERVLTHGGPASEPLTATVAHRHELVDYAGSRLTILPGGGVTWQNAEKLASALGVSEVHGTKIVQL